MYSNLVYSNWISALANHLWQSTVFVVAAWLLAFVLRKNQASTRYWIWLSASLKFLMPFFLLIEAGRRIGTVSALHGARPTVSPVVERVTQPFSQTELLSFASPNTSLNHAGFWPVAALSVWAAGALILTFIWALRWWRLRVHARIASPYPLDAAVPVLSSETLLEPGIFGIVRPVLMLPRGITDRLTPAQLNSVLAHEMCHVRRRDNLTFAMHMAVETIFWFHPFVWWMRTRLIEERERACDEAVLQSGNEAEIYAEGILNVCKFYVESPLACAAGVTGSDLKRRIVRIMTAGLGKNLSLGRKLLLSAIAFLAVSLPVFSGLLHTSEIFAQTKVLDTDTSIPEFEVATIKPNNAGDNRMQFLFNNTGISLQGVPVQMILREAFDVGDDRILGAPGWVKSNHFDVEAKVSSEDAPKLDGISIEKRRQMLLPLLAERFNLKYHHETRELPVYSLMIAKGGSKLKDAPVQGAEERSGIRMSGPGDFEGMNAGMNVLCHVLSGQPELSHTIVDKTGLTGKYNFTLQWTPAEVGPAGSNGAPSPSDSNKPSLFTALQEQLGLKLEVQKSPIDVIVIDHIEAPSAN